MQPDHSLDGVLRASLLIYLVFREIEEELTSNVELSTMGNLKAEFHEHLTRPWDVKYDEKMNTCLLESQLEMSKSHANVVALMRRCLICRPQ